MFTRKPQTIFSLASLSRKPQTIFSLASLFQSEPHTIRLERLVVSGNAVEIVLETVSTTAPCPCCGKHSERVHSRYLRTLTDLPAQGRRARLQIQVRRVFCHHGDWPRAIFAARPPDPADARARTTLSLPDPPRASHFPLGADAGLRLA